MTLTTTMTSAARALTATWRTSALVPALAGLLLLAAACSGGAVEASAPAGAGGTASPAGAGGSGLSSVLFLGDSVAAGEALPLGAAFAASGVRFRSIASDGGGNVVGPFSGKRWRTLPGQIASARPSVVVYQITTYDWGGRKEQRAAYRRLLSVVSDAGAKLVFVTSPPIRPDDFYRPHMADLRRAPVVARAVAAESAGRAFLLDAGEVWGPTYRRGGDDRPDRSTDGIHTCPQGAARFAGWLLGALAERFPGFTPAAPATWANTGWSADRHFTGC
jgi:hypothetical protein